MKRRHSMPFGAQRTDDGKVRFRLWAPAAEQISVCLENPSRKLSLASKGEGWFELIADSIPSGTRYRYQINGGQEVPDPASRFQPENVHGPSEVIEPSSFEWHDEKWNGRLWEEAVIYELHVGTFSPEGTFLGAKQKLEYLSDLGITAIELMPVSDFPGRRNWGYDGVLPFAPDSVYGRPEDLKELVQSAHALGIMMFLDVVYNHFGPEGNYLGLYSPQFFTSRHKTPWGNAINFDGREGPVVRDFFIHNALYWLQEFHFDGLRLDAVHCIVDDSPVHFLEELAERVRKSAEPGHHVHLILENEHNHAGFLRRSVCEEPQKYDAQWNDDIHHTLHVLTTGEQDGYYSDYSSDPLNQLGRCLISGFAYQGDVSIYSGGKRRGESTAGLPLSAFVAFLQNHDQIGNRAFGERLLIAADPCAVRAATEILLIAPSIPLIFMGEEFGATTPFLFFCDFEAGLAEAVVAGRRNEFARFLRFNDPEARAGIPDPNSEKTFECSRLDWNASVTPQSKDWFALHRRLLHLRKQYITASMSGDCRREGGYQVIADQGLRVVWNFSNGAELALLANLGAKPLPGFSVPSGEMFYASEDVSLAPEQGNVSLLAWSVAWFLRA